MDGPRLTPSRRTAAILAALLLAGVLTAATLVLSLRVTLGAPPAPTILRGPESPTSSTTATFIFTDEANGVVFGCSLDAGAYSVCANGETYTGLGDGRHTFRVTARNSSGQASKPASYGWIVDTGTSEGQLGFPGGSKPQPSPAGGGSPASPPAPAWTVVVKGSFAISGNTTGLFAPGVTEPLDLSFTNPFGFALKVLSVTITVQHGTTQGGHANPGCDGPTNMVVIQGFTGAVTVPGHTTTSLQALGVPQAEWPHVEMPDLSTNQDACKGTTFTFSYSGTATKG